MKVRVELLDGFTYKASGEKFLVKLVVQSQTLVWVESNINVNILEFNSLDIDDFCFGINRTVTSMESELVKLTSDKPITIDIDLFGDDILDEEEEVLPGRYRVECEVTVFQSEDGKRVARTIQFEEELFIDVLS